MNLINLTSILADNGMTLAEKGIASAKVILTGFIVVFAVLLLLIFIINIYGAIIQKAMQGGKKKKEKISEPENKAPVVASAANVPQAPAPSVQDGISDEVVAVISAAVAAVSDSSSKTRIKSIKKSDGTRSAWANAGILDNTRPF